MTAKNNSQKVIFNPNDECCPLCAGINNIYFHNQLQQHMILPEYIGKGYYNRIIIRPTIEMAICDMRFYDSINLGGQDNWKKPDYNFSFFLDGEMHLRTKDKKVDYTVHSGDCCVFNNSASFATLHVEEGQCFSYINIGMSGDTISDLFHNVTVNKMLSGLFQSKPIKRTSISIQRILNDITHCELSGIVKKVYLEAKVIELFAVYIDEILAEDQVIQSTSFLKDDMLSIYKAKEIIDNDTANAPSLSDLTRMVCLSDYKLQAGFKKLFGMTVYAYIIDKRLEKAKLLLEHGNIKVSDAASYVGYNELGRFAEKFRKKYGVNPSEYAKK